MGNGHVLLIREVLVGLRDSVLCKTFSVEIVY